MKRFLLLLLFLLFIFSAPISAHPLIPDPSYILLERRLNDWPEWRLPGPFNQIALQKDIVYPSWFNGAWTIRSSDLNNPGNASLEYEAKFKLNSFNEIVGDRSFNAFSVGKAVLGDTLLKVQDDPKSPNRQMATFDDQIFLETKIIGRNQALKSGSVFFIDELALQIFHNLDVSRIKRVETLSKFHLCKQPNATFEDFSEKTICGEQWQAIYPGPGESLGSKPLKTSHYKLIFKRSL